MVTICFALKVIKRCALFVAAPADQKGIKPALRPVTAATTRPRPGKEEKEAEMEKLRQSLLFARAEKERLERLLKAVNREQARPASGFERTLSQETRKRNKERRCFRSRGVSRNVGGELKDGKRRRWRRRLEQSSPICPMHCPPVIRSG